MTVEQLIEKLSKYPKDTEILHSNVIAVIENDLADLSDDFVDCESTPSFCPLEILGNIYKWEYDLVFIIDDNPAMYLSKKVKDIEYSIYTYEGDYYTISDEENIIGVGVENFNLVLDVIKNPKRGIKHLLESKE